MRLAGAAVADQQNVFSLINKLAGQQLLDQSLFDRRLSLEIKTGLLPKI